MGERSITILLQLWESLKDFVYPVYNFLASSVTIGGTSVSVMSLLFGSAVGIFLFYTVATWIGNLIT